MIEVSAHHMLREFGQVCTTTSFIRDYCGGTVKYIATEDFNGYEMGKGMSLILLFVYCSIVKLASFFFVLLTIEAYILLRRLLDIDYCSQGY